MPHLIHRRYDQRGIDGPLVTKSVQHDRVRDPAPAHPRTPQEVGTGPPEGDVGVSVEVVRPGLQAPPDGFQRGAQQVIPIEPVAPAPTRDPDAPIELIAVDRIPRIGHVAIPKKKMTQRRWAIFR
jgi:hypothetical protein